MQDEKFAAQNQKLKRAMRPVREVFEKFGVPYAVCGSVACVAHGLMRFTMDIDVVAQLEASHVAPFTEILTAQNYFVDEFMIADALRYKRSFNILDENTGFKIDIFISKDRPFDREMLARRIPGFLGQDTEPAFDVESSEDLVLSKLAWFRLSQGASDHQWSDVASVLKMNFFDIDTNYLRHWAPELGVSDLLEKALDEAGYNE